MNSQIKRIMYALLTFSVVVLGDAQAAAPELTPPASMTEEMKEMHMPAGAKGMGTMHAMGSMDMKAHMRGSMENMQNMTLTGNADKDFAMMMRMHHQCAVEMAQMQVSHGKNAEMNAMAKKIVTTQTKEVAQLDRWIAKQK